MRDLETVVEATGLERFALFGISQGCAVSIAYAVRHPERVSRLILYGGYARGRRMRGSQQEIEQSDAILTLMREGWGQENPAFRHDIHVAVHSRRHRRADAMVQRPAAQDHIAGERHAHSPGDGRASTSADLLPQVQRPDPGPACRDDAAAPVRGGPPHRGGHSRRALRRAGWPQSSDSRRPIRRGSGSSEEIKDFLRDVKARNDGRVCRDHLTEIAASVAQEACSIPRQIWHYSRAGMM